MSNKTGYVLLVIAAIITMRVGWYLVEQHREKEKKAQVSLPSAPAANYDQGVGKHDTTFIINAYSN